MRTSVLSCAVAAVLAGSACRGDAPAQAPPAPAATAPAPVQQSSLPRIVFLGDSLTTGLGLAADQSFPAIIGRRLAAEGYRYEIVNAGVSGDTSAGGLRRLDWSLDGDVKVLVVALGANDGLRGLSPADMKTNLTQLLDRATAKGVTVILAGMEAPPNFGPDYTRQFRAVYQDLADSYGVRFVPFLLNGVAGEATLNQADGIHPNARGTEMVADLVLAELRPVLGRPTSGTR